MKTNFKSALTAGLLTGCIALQTAVLPMSIVGTSYGAQTPRLTAGVSAFFSDQLIQAQINNRMTVQVNDNTPAAYTSDIASVDENGAVTICGYSNIGMAVVDTNLNIRKEPAENAEVIGKLPKNGACEVLDIQNGWVKITSGNVSGWASAEYLLTGEEAVAMAENVAREVATVTTNTLYVREEPNTDCSILSSVAMNEELTIIEKGEGWIKIALDSDEGWVCADYVDVGYKLPKASTISELRYGAGVSDVRVSLVSYALQFVGGKYVWGGTSLSSGVDCSGFTMKIYQKFGISLPHYSVSQSHCGTRIKASQAKPGDLFFYGAGSSINHVAIYIGNGQIVHASNERSGIKVSNAFYRTPICVVRLIND